MSATFDRLRFYVTFPCVPIPVVEVWRILSNYLNINGYLPKQFEVSQIVGHQKKYFKKKRLKLTSEEIEQLIDDRNLDGFGIESGSNSRSLDFKLYHAKNYGMQSTFYGVVGKEAKSPNDWKPMLEILLTRFHVAGAWQWQGLYRDWQGANCIDSGYEEFYGELPPGFRTWQETSVDGSLPGKTLIDISQNPGRSKQLYPYSYYYPSAEMWLGPHFWQYAKCTKEEVLAAGFFIEKRETPHFLYLKCWPVAFTRPDGEQGRMQQRLWKLFFHEDCEWPPGSGTICDEPTYGPPELMPDFTKIL